MSTIDGAKYKTQYEKLNPAQRKAVDTTTGPVLVVAGPGTGKTELLSLRVANILLTHEVSPHNILCLTFTENGAINMRERLSKILRQDAYRVGIYTFHAFANSIISRYPEYFYGAASFSRATDLDRVEILEHIFRGMPHGHPLGSYHPVEGYVYMKDTMDRIKHIKSGGYTAVEYRSLVERLLGEAELIDAVIAQWPTGRLTIKRLPEVETVLHELQKIESATATYYARTLEHATTLAREAEKMEAVATWKKRMVVEIDDGKYVTKDTYAEEKIRAVAHVYQAYSDALRDAGLYDYDDMIIDVVHALRENYVLRSELEEQYQFILIDEFQDTNDAQMELVRAISENPVHEGRPNVMVVGDDDQAIYKFQGAEISNIIHFRERTYKDVTTVVLDTNYRSHESLLALARKVVTQGENRLETRSRDISKVLSQGNKAIAEGKISIRRFDTDVEEYATVARTIKERIASGVPPEEIALLARNHRELKVALPYLDHEDIPYEYVKKANVFDEPHIRELIVICEYVSSLMGDEMSKDYLLPRILSFPYFAIDRKTLFSVSLLAKEKGCSFARATSECTEDGVVRVHTLLSELVAGAHSVPLEHLLHRYIDVSGFKEHYFGAETMRKRPATYIAFLASLKTFIGAMREWREGEELFAKDVAPFVDLHRMHDIALISESPFMKAEHAVNIMSAHASKGLEFEEVFLISAHDELWTRGPRANKAPLPSALYPLLSPAGDTEDDFIRLFYVAMTRAKRSLAITGHRALIRYIDPADGTNTKTTFDDGAVLPPEAHETALSIVRTPFREDEWAILRRLVEGYVMSPTHMSNFLDVTSGGPMHFIEQNLLRFPQPMNVSAVYGSAAHRMIAELVIFPKFNAGEIPSYEHLFALFTRELAKGRLPRMEYARQERRGADLIRAYLRIRAPQFTREDVVELDMKHEGVSVGDARITGKIDFLHVTKEGYEVVDFKTGRAYEGWEGGKLRDDERIKLRRYRQQLLFYRILLEASSTYTLPVRSLGLEFVESATHPHDPVLLSLAPTEDELIRMKKLIEAVYHKIVTLSLPDVSHYSPDLAGIIAFEDDLIAGSI